MMAGEEHVDARNRGRSVGAAGPTGAGVVAVEVFQRAGSAGSSVWPRGAGGGGRAVAVGGDRAVHVAGARAVCRLGGRAEAAADLVGARPLPALDAARRGDARRTGDA